MLTITECRARRRENRKLMKRASPAMLKLCQELDDVLAVMIWKLTHQGA